MRSRLSLLAIGAAAVLLSAPAVRAQDAGSTAWSGSALTMPSSSGVGVVHVEAAFNRSPSRVITITIETTGGVSEGCALPGPASGFGRTPTSLAADLTFNCNGSYTVTAYASTSDDNSLQPHDEAARTGVVDVSMPAPEVTGVSASGSGRSISIVWDDMRAAAPDLSAYVVERSIGGGAFTRVAELSSTATSYTDEDLPADAGEATYRVSSIRPSPAGAQVSAASDTQATPFTAAPAPPPGDGTPGDGTTGDGTTGDGTTPGTTGDGTAPGSTPGTAPDTTAPNPAGGPSRPGIGVRVPRLGLTGTFLPPLLRPSSSLSPPTTVDGGFSDQLPYGEVEPGEDDPVLPDDELASLFTDGAAGRGMAIPVATALVLAVWAFHLRFLARASRPT